MTLIEKNNKALKAQQSKLSMFHEKSGETINCCEFLYIFFSNKSSKGIRRLSCFCSICLTQLTSPGRWAEAGSKAGTVSDTCCGGEGKSFSMFPFTLVNTCIHTFHGMCARSDKHSRPHLLIPANCQHLSSDEYSHRHPFHPLAIFVYLLIFYFPAKTLRMSSEAYCSKIEADKIGGRRCQSERWNALKAFLPFVDKSMNSWGRQHVARDGSVIITRFYEYSRWHVNEENQTFLGLMHTTLLISDKTLCQTMAIQLADCEPHLAHQFACRQFYWFLQKLSCKFICLRANRL